jgi:hypothetical protein
MSQVSEATNLPYIPKIRTSLLIDFVEDARVRNLFVSAFYANYNTPQPPYFLVPNDSLFRMPQRRHQIEKMT